MNVADRHAQTSLLLLVAQGEDQAVIADAAVRIWQAMFGALAPIIGARGVAALFARSLYLTRPRHPWMADVREDLLQPGTFSTLHVALCRQTAPDAVDAHGALLQAYYDLLTTLIGGSLTERLVQSVLDQPSNGDAVRDTTP